MIGDIVRESWGYTYRISNDSWIYWVMVCWLVVLTGAIILLNVDFYLSTTDIKKKHQTRHVIMGFSCVILGVIAEVVISYLRLDLPETASIAMTLMCLFIAYAIWKYELFIISPTTAAEIIISTMPDCCFLAAPDGTIMMVNRSLQELLGYRKEELNGKHVSILLPPDKAEEFNRDVLHGHYKRNFINDYETQFRTRAGSPIDISYSGAIVKSGGRRIVGYVGIARDMTERRIMEEEREKLRQKLFQSEKMVAIGQLAGGIAHEINNPMSVILGFAQSVSKSIASETHPLYLPVKSIEREALRCKKMISDLLTFSRTSRAEREPVHLCRLISETLSLVETKCKSKSIDVAVQVPEDLPQVMANRNGMQQVLINLCNNAVDAMSEEGRLLITAAVHGKQPPQMVKIAVTDNGSGIAPEHLERVFEPFFTTKEVGSGTGLGLSVSYEIVKKHGGVIEVKSELGKGSTFTIRFPGN
jgi:PAS domain S-box-containing protein